MKMRRKRKKKKNQRSKHFNVCWRWGKAEVFGDGESGIYRECWECQTKMTINRFGYQAQIKCLRKENKYFTLIFKSCLTPNLQLMHLWWAYIPPNKIIMIILMWLLEVCSVFFKCQSDYQWTSLYLFIMFTVYTLIFFWALSSMYHHNTKF